MDIRSKKELEKMYDKGALSHHVCLIPLIENEINILKLKTKGIKVNWNDVHFLYNN